MYRPPASEYIRCGKVVHLDCNFMDELKEHLFRDHGFRLRAAEICFMESAKTVKTNPISCDLFQLQHDESGESHI